MPEIETSPRTWGWTVVGGIRLWAVTTSPRTWGWTGSRAPGGARLRDVPTHVGVDPRSRPHRRRCRGRPHARGGGPRPSGPRRTLRATSPRTWGWTPSKWTAANASGDVPTHVGVDRR